MGIYFYYGNLRGRVCLHVHMIIYTVIVHSSRLYTWLCLCPTDPTGIAQLLSVLAPQACCS